MNRQLIRDRHAPTMRSLRECVDRLAEPDQHVIVVVYDGKTATTREVSYMALNQLDRCSISLAVGRSTSEMRRPHAR